MGKRDTSLRIAVRLLSILLLYCSFTSGVLIVPASADTTSRIEKKIETKKLEEKDIQREIKQKKEKIKEAVREEKSILTKIHDINMNIKKIQSELKSLDRRISETQTEIVQLSGEITSLNSVLERREQYLIKRLRALYKQQYGGNALTLISADDYQDLIRRSKYISLLAYHDGKIMSLYKEQLKELDAKKTEMEALQAGLESSKEDIVRKNRQLKYERTRKDRLLSTIRSKRSNYEKTIRDLEESARELRKMIDKLEQMKVPESVTGKGFMALRGHLAWPVNGTVAIPFGQYKDPQFNITVFKNGIEIKAAGGDKPRAVANGRVVYADWFKGYGLLLIINHGSGYHSLYGNLSEIFHETGDIINKGTVIGEIGKSSLLNVPTLYFEIRHKGKPVDPMKWLKQKHRKRRR